MQTRSVDFLIVNFNDLVPADHYFFLSRSVKILLGVNILSTILKDAIMKRDENLPFAVNSKFRWIISGTKFFNTCQLLTFSVNNFEN